MPYEELDKYCSDILNVLLAYNQKIRFNELYKRLKTMKYKISRPTLADHLKHLVKRKEILRKTEGKQNVTYELNHKRYANIKKAVEIQNELLKIFTENEKNFNEMQVEDQLFYTIATMVLRELRTLRLDIDTVLNPENRFQNILETLFINHPNNMFYEHVILHNLIKDGVYCEKMLKALDEGIDKVAKELYKEHDERTEKLQKLISNYKEKNG